ncbi:hypothetical protein [uncultured Bartonella sp.]|uniref:hypothetical protein n=1 Tax=uncultured Bartonella sp. TaxID=104108 RepID=UPI00263900E4|nr:hypothetical protein [uncultured Bartonella sp.]
MNNRQKLTIAALACAILFCSGYYMSGNGYLNRIGEQRMLLNIAPPARGSAEQKKDEFVFLKTRSYKDSARWKQAIADSKASVAEIVNGFGCATGRQISAKNMQNFFKLLSKTNEDAERLAHKSKKEFKIAHPYMLYGGVTCTKPLGYDYPSGHAIQGWIIARLLVEFYPERRAEIFSHARSFAESRVICGVHSVSAVEVDEDYSAKIIDRLKKIPAFQNDLSAAKVEMLTLKMTPMTGQSCRKFPPKYVKPFSFNSSLLSRGQ